MDKLLLKEIALEQQKIQKSFELGTQREDLAWLEKYISSPHAVIISGMRRVGKSTLLAQAIKHYYDSKAFYFNFEDERLLDFRKEDFNHLYEVLIELFGDQKVFFFDEIQNVPHWEAFVRRMQDRGYKFFITGSNASLLSKELGTRLTGRNIVLELFPFSFKEYLAFRDVKIEANDLLDTQKRALIKKHFQEYLKKGGVPEYNKYQDPVFLKRIYEDILYRDIVARHDIKEVKALRELGLYLLSNVSTPFSYNGLKTILRLKSDVTVKQYISFLEDCYLVFTVPRFFYSVKQQLVAHKKAYCIDNGFMHVIASGFTKNRTVFLKNLVFVELRRKCPQIFYYRTKNDQEIDFLVQKDPDHAQLVHVVDGLQQNKDDVIEALICAMKELKLKEALILTEDHDEEIKRDGTTITAMPVYRWILS
ncbi:MAG: ATP-binding protein [Candidatus Omnitrophota bacterium]